MDTTYWVLMHIGDWEYHFATSLNKRKQSKKHYGADGMIRVAYKYKPTEGVFVLPDDGDDFSQNEIIFMLPDDSGNLKKILGKRYSIWSSFALWWEDLVDETEEEQDKLANII